MRELFEELGVFENGKWDERRLCFAPQERLYLHGRWQEGIEPEGESTGRDRDDYRRFHDRMAEFRASGEFTIPMERGAKQSALDRMSMRDWMAQEKFTSPYLNWYINYACRDDFGALARDTSAWAGIHYFAARDPEEKGPLAWPEGNGWIVRRLMERLAPHSTHCQPGVCDRARRPEAARQDRVGRIHRRPGHFRRADVPGAVHRRRRAGMLADFVYSPWLTANLTIEHPPEDVAWDNVIYDSPTLGYVDATHMSLKTFIDRSVWTFYWALAERTPAESRELLLRKGLALLARSDPERSASRSSRYPHRVSRIDIMRIGHAMARPVPGFLASETRRHFAESKGPIYYANSDLSGFSIFEEAQYRGVSAADRALRIGL